MQREVRILRQEEVFNRAIFKIQQIVLQHTQTNGALTPPLTRLVLDRGDAAAVLVHDVDADQLIFTEQFRLPTHEHGPGWLLEVPAGMLDGNEAPEACARRETMEELGYTVRELKPIGSFYLSPGGSSERIHLFYARVSAANRLTQGGGLQSEGEDICLVRLHVNEAIDRAKKGTIDDAKTLIAIQWLALTLASTTSD